MKKILFTVGLWCLALCMQAAGHISRLRAELQDSRSDYVFVVAHRGDWRHAPENSVAAIKGAADMGVDMVEIDIQRTKDGGFVLMHDGIDRTTEGKGNVADYTVEELKRFRLRRADGSLSDETIPTLEEALTACKGAVLVNIDKGGDYLSEIAPIIRKTGTEDHVVLKGRGTVEEVERQLSGYSLYARGGSRWRGSDTLRRFVPFRIPPTGRGGYFQDRPFCQVVLLAGDSRIGLPCLDQYVVGEPVRRP